MGAAVLQAERRISLVDASLGRSSPEQSAGLRADAAFIARR